MLDAIRDFFERHIGAPDERDPEHAIRVATAALLVEVARIDGEVNETWSARR